MFLLAIAIAHHSRTATPVHRNFAGRSKGKARSTDGIGWELLGEASQMDVAESGLRDASRADKTTALLRQDHIHAQRCDFRFVRCQNRSTSWCQSAF